MIELFLSVTFLFAIFATFLVRKYVLNKAILDVPNDRSAHTVPIPRGGGLAIAITFYLGVTLLLCLKIITLPLFLALLGGILIAAIGYLDDIASLSAKKRAVFHFIAAIWALYWLGGFPQLDLGFIQIHLGWIGDVLAVFLIVWLINLYNFMDGIDGIAGSEAVFVAGVTGIFFYLFGFSSFAGLCGLLAVSVMGFLIWNWPPAKIFLGDVGSGLLGFIFAVLMLATAKQHVLSLFSWLILLSVFVFDATFTLFHRIQRGERWYSAHKEHVYQRLLQNNYSHRSVTLGVIRVNLFILLPVFCLSVYWPRSSVVWFMLLFIAALITWHKLLNMLKST